MCDNCNTPEPTAFTVTLDGENYLLQNTRECRAVIIETMKSAITNGWEISVIDETGHDHTFEIIIAIAKEGLR